MGRDEPAVKAIGDLIKYDIIDVPMVEVDGFFRQATEEDWTIEDILDAWNEDEKYINTLLFPLKLHRSQFNLIKDKLTCVYEFKNKEYQGEFIFLIESDKIPVSDLKNTDELSGEGAVVLEFNLRFTDFPKHYTRRNTPEDKEFFNLKDNQMIINTVRLVIDRDQSLGTKLTGKAAEIAARKAKEAKEIIGG